jgi:hypothetical protein
MRLAIGRAGNTSLDLRLLGRIQTSGVRTGLFATWWHNLRSNGMGGYPLYKNCAIDKRET